MKDASATPSLSLIVLLLLTACTGAGTTVEGQGSSNIRDVSGDGSLVPRESETVADADLQPDGDQSAAVVEPPPPPEELALDLAAYAHYAEVTQTEGVLCDLGTPSGHRCTFGGHRTGWGENAEEEGVTFSHMRRRRATLHFPLEQPDGATLVVRIKPTAARRLEARLGGRRVGTAQIEPGAWNTAQIPIPADRLVRGDNSIVLFLRGGGGAGARARVDWVWLGSGTPPDDIETPEVLPVEGEDGDTLAITLPPRTTLGYSLRVPQNARLELDIETTEGPSIVTFRAIRESEPPMELAELSLEAGQRGEISRDLSSLAEEVVRLDITSGEGALTLHRPALWRQLDTSDSPEEDSELPRATNLIIILIDTLRADHLTTYNPSTRVQSEFFVQLAQRSVVFDAAQAQENWTKPSIATLLTSLYPSSHNAKTGEAVLPDDVEMLGEILGERGFVTAAFIANGYVSDRFGFRQGWDTYRNYVRERIRNRADRVVDDSIAWLESRSSDQPFFLYIHTIDPHVPYCPPTRYRALYDPDPYHGPIAASRTAQLLGEIKSDRMETSARDRFRLEALYDGEITYHDEHFGRLLAALEEQGLMENTLIWVTSDHGEEFFDHDSVGHGHSLYQELLHVPLVLSLPGSDNAVTGSRIPHDVGLIDIIPTSLELMGLDPHDDAQGRSLVPMLRGTHPQIYEASFSDFLDGGRAVRSDDLKLIIQGDNVSLYDLSTDPREQRDLSETRPLSLRYLTTLLSMYIGSAERPQRSRRLRPRPVHRREETVIDEETREQLRALGYMD